MNDTPSSSSSRSDGPLVEKVLDRIKDERMAPAPRWQFAARNGLFWTLWIASALLGAMAVAAAMYTVANAGWEFRELTHSGLGQFLVEKIPVLWLVALAFATIVAYENLRHTERGYRYPLLVVVGGSVFVSAILGAAFYANGVGQRVEEGIGSHIPFHRSAMKDERVRWTNPQRGFLAGEVVSVSPEQNVFSLRSFDGGQWTVSLDDVSGRGRATIDQFPLVRVVGIPMPTSSGVLTTFRACFVFPWTVRGGTDGNGNTFVMRVADPSGDFLQSQDCQNLVPFRTLRTLEDSMLIR